MARFNLGATGNRLSERRRTDNRQNHIHPGGGLPGEKKEYYTIVGGGHKTKVREYEILTD